MRHPSGPAMLIEGFKTIVLPPPQATRKWGECINRPGLSRMLSPYTLGARLDRRRAGPAQNRLGHSHGTQQPRLTA